MASTKAGGTTKNLRDSNPKYLGVKRSDGTTVNPGEVIVRQRGTKILPGRNIGVGKDHTLFAKIDGRVNFRVTMGGRTYVSVDTGAAKTAAATKAPAKAAAAK